MKFGLCWQYVGLPFSFGLELLKYTLIAEVSLLLAWAFVISSTSKIWKWCYNIYIYIYIYGSVVYGNKNLGDRLEVGTVIFL